MTRDNVSLSLLTVGFSVGESGSDPAGRSAGPFFRAEVFVARPLYRTAAELEKEASFSFGK